MNEEIKIYTTKDFKKQATDFFAKYELKNIVVCPETKITNLLPAKDRICRFCGLASPDVSFKNKAHIIPAFLGNKYLINDFECDKCNSIMSIYEKHLSDFLGISRVFYPSANKNKQPKLTSGDGRIFTQQINFRDTPLIRVEGTQPGIFEWSEDDKSITLIAPKVKYIPQFVYKSLMKIGLSLIPKDELKEYNAAFKFLISKEKFKIEGITKLSCYYSTKFNVPVPYAFLLKKKNEDDVLPTHFLFLYYGSLILQIMLPLNKKDIAIFSRNNNELTIPIPAPIYLFSPPAGKIFQKISDLSSSEYNEDDVVTWYMKPEENALSNLITFP